jgi:hypothetical protein
MVLRSLRAWLLVLAVSLGLGAFVSVVGILTDKPMTGGGPLGNFCAAAFVGTLLAYAVGLPLKGILWLVQTARS